MNESLSSPTPHTFQVNSFSSIKISITLHSLATFPALPCTQLDAPSLAPQGPPTGCLAKKHPELRIRSVNENR